MSFFKLFLDEYTCYYLVMYIYTGLLVSALDTTTVHMYIFGKYLGTRYSEVGSRYSVPYPTCSNGTRLPLHFVRTSKHPGWLGRFIPITGCYCLWLSIIHVDKIFNIYFCLFLRKFIFAIFTNNSPIYFRLYYTSIGHV